MGLRDPVETESVSGQTADSQPLRGWNLGTKAGFFRARCAARRKPVLDRALARRRWGFDRCSSGPRAGS